MFRKLRAFPRRRNVRLYVCCTFQFPLRAHSTTWTLEPRGISINSKLHWRFYLSRVQKSEPRSLWCNHDARSNGSLIGSKEDVFYVAYDQAHRTVYVLQIAWRQVNSTIMKLRANIPLHQHFHFDVDLKID